MMQTKKSLVLHKLEGSYGDDAIAGVAPDDRGQLAAACAESSFDADWESIDRRLQAGTLSRDVTPVGHGEAEIGLKMDLRGSGSAAVESDFGQLLPSCAMQREDATKLLLESITVNDFESTPRVAASIAKFVRGEQVFGQFEIAGASWDDAPGSGSGTGTAPLVGEQVAFWPTTADETQATAQGTVMAISGTTVLVRIDFGNDARPESGWFIKNLAATGYQALAEDMPVAIILDHGPAVPAVADEGILWAYVAQGSFAAGDQITAHANDVIADVKTDGVSTEGYVYRPDSEMWVQCEVDAWHDFLTGTPGGGAPPVVGEELQRTDVGGGPASGSFMVRGVSGTGGVTLKLSEDFGKVEPGARLINPTTLAYAHVVANPAPSQIRTPSQTLYHMSGGTLIHKATGCRGNASFELRSGNPGMVDFQFRGVPRGELRLERPKNLWHLSTVPPNWAGGAGELLGYPLRVLSATLNLGNEVVREPNANALGGTQGFLITDRDPELQLTVERPGHKGWQFEEAVRNATWRPFAAIIGKAAGNIMGVIVPRMQITKVTEGDESGILTAQLTVKPRRIAGDDEVLIHTR